MNGGAVTWVLDADDSKFKSTLAKSSATARLFGSSLNSLGRDLRGNLQSSLRAVGEDFINLGRRIGSIAWTGVKVGAGIAGAAVAAMGIFAIKTASELQSMQISMIGLTKSVNLGKEAMAGAYKFAQKAPFQLKEVADTTKQLIAFGIESKQAVKYLDLLGNVSLSTGLPIKELGFIFGRVSASGRVMAEDINQLTSQGVAILPALQKQLGKTGQEVRTMASQGEIGFEVFRAAMESIVDPNIMNMIENTLPRQLDRLKGSLRILGFSFVGVGVDAVNGFTSAKDGISQVTVDITRSVANLLRSPSVTNAARAMGTTIALALAEIPKFIDSNKAKIDDFFNGIARFFDNINAIAKEDGIRAAFAQVGQGLGDAVAAIDMPGIISNLSNKVLDSDFSALMSAFTQKFIEGFFTMDWTAISAALVKGFLIHVLDIGLAVAGGLIQGIIDAVKEDPLDALSTILFFIFAPAKVIAKLAELLSKISIVGPIAGWILTSLKGVVDLVTAPVKNLLSRVGKSVLDGISSGVSSITQTLRTKVLDPIIKFFEPAGRWLIGHGKSIISGLSNGISQMGRSVWNAVSGVSANIGRFFSGAAGWLWNTGKAIIQGLVNGIRSMSGAAAEAAKGVARDAIQGAKNLLGIKSPSTVFAGIGRNVALGLAGGIAGGAGLVKSATDSMTSNMLGGIGTPSMVTGGTSGGINNSHTVHIGVINIAKEVDGERLIRKLTRDQVVVDNGLTPSRAF